MIETPPGWLPNDKASVDPQLQTDLSDIKEHPPTQQEYMAFYNTHGRLDRAHEQGNNFGRRTLGSVAEFRGSFDHSASPFRIDQ